jgi:hypothetical protein
MKVRLLLALLLLPALAYADALSAYGMGQAVAAILALGATLLVALCFLVAMYSWPRWRGLPYLLGAPLLLLAWARLSTPNYDNYRYLTPLLLLALLLNGLVWVRPFRPLPTRRAGAVAILLASAGLVGVFLGFRVLPDFHPPRPADEDRTYTYVEDMPDDATVKALIERRLVLPPKAPHGRVLVQFMVSKQGVVSQPQIEEGMGAPVDSAVVAAVRLLPDFTPGTQDGQPVALSLLVWVDVGEHAPRE